MAPAKYAASMNAAVPLEIRLAPELRAELETLLRPGESLTDFVDAAVRGAMAYRRVRADFHARASAASAQYHCTGVSMPVDAVLDRLQSKLDARRKTLD